MAYSRIGVDSDVYVWSDNTYLWVHVSPVIEIDDPTAPVGMPRLRHHRAGVTLSFTDRSECYAMLGALAAEGVNVPGYLFVRLYDEIANMGNDVRATKPRGTKGTS